MSDDAERNHDTSESAESSAPTGSERSKSAPARRRPVSRGTSLRRPDSTGTPAEPAAAPSVEPAAKPADPATAESESSETSSRSAKSARRHRLPVVIVAAAVVIGVLASVVLLIRPAAEPVDNRAFVDTALTTQVTSVAKQAAKQIYTIDMNNLEPWEQELGTVLSAGMIDEAKRLRTAITQSAGALQDVTVKVDDADLTAGVSLARENHAEVLLNVRQQVANQGVPLATTQSPMKFVIDKFDGNWKVTSITPL